MSTVTDTTSRTAGLSFDPWDDKVTQAPTDQSQSTLFSDLLNASQLEVDAETTTTADSLARSTATSEYTEDRFLTLLLAQMNNQDPLNPLENAEITTQLAQISTVSGIEGLNKSMEKLVEKLAGSNPVDSAAMIDRQVLVSGDTLKLTGEGGAPVRGGGTLTSSAEAVGVQIYDGSGEAVRELSLGPQAAGLVTFEWDGTDADGEALPAGDYRFQVIGASADGTEIAAPQSTSTVIGVTRSGDALSLRLANGATVPAETVNGVF